MRIILILLLLCGFVFGIYYAYTDYYKRKLSYVQSQTVNRDKVFSNLKIETVLDSNGAGFYVNAKWESRIKPPAGSSVFMEFVITQNSKGTYKKVIAVSETKSNLVNPGSSYGELSCFVKRSDLQKDYPYQWVKINSVINKVKQKPIVYYVGKN